MQEDNMEACGSLNLPDPGTLTLPEKRDQYFADELFNEL
jgi:hypothetical protein